MSIIEGWVQLNKVKENSKFVLLWTIFASVLLRLLCLLLAPLDKMASHNNMVSWHACPASPCQPTGSGVLLMAFCLSFIASISSEVSLICHLCLLQNYGNVPHTSKSHWWGANTKAYVLMLSCVFMKMWSTSLGPVCKHLTGGAITCFCSASACTPSRSCRKGKREAVEEPVRCYWSVKLHNIIARRKRGDIWSFAAHAFYSHFIYSHIASCQLFILYWLYHEGLSTMAMSCVCWDRFCHRRVLKDTDGSWSYVSRLQTAVGCSLILLALIHKWFSHFWLPGVCELQIISLLYQHHLYLFTQMHPFHTFLTLSNVNLRKTAKSRHLCAGQWKTRNHCSHAAVLQSPTMHLCTTHREHAQYSYFKITFLLCPLSSIYIPLASCSAQCTDTHTHRLACTADAH